MQNIDRLNFKEHINEIICHIDDADFIAIDAEFSSLQHSKETKIYYTDKQSEFYEKSVKNVSNSLLLQYGITTAKYNEIDNSYETKTYSFDLFPSLYLTNNLFLTFQGHSIRFLTNNNFDFNQCFKNGIPYLSAHNYEYFYKILDKYKSKPNYIHRLFDTYEIYSIYNPIKADIDKFINSTDTTLVISFKNHCEFIISGILINITHDYKSIIPNYTNNNLCLKKVNNNQNNDTICYDLKDLLYDSYGFSHIYQYILSKNKIIVGHNLFLDLLFSIDKFHTSLPKSLKEFKSLITKQLPKIYDTKYLVKFLQDNNILSELKRISLSDLYEYFVKYNNTDIQFPKVNHDTSNQYHNAGFDSFATAYVFIHLLHLFHHTNKTCSNNMLFKDSLNILNDHVNHLNLVGISNSTLKLNDSSEQYASNGLIERIIDTNSIDQFDKVEILLLLSNMFKGKVIECNGKLSLIGETKAFNILKSKLDPLGIQLQRPIIPYNYRDIIRRLWKPSFAIGLCVLAAALTTKRLFY